MLEQAQPGDEKGLRKPYYYFFFFFAVFFLAAALGGADFLAAPFLKIWSQP